MMFHSVFLLLCINSWTAGNPDTGIINTKHLDRSISYSYWPSFHNAAKMMRIRKRQIQEQVGPNEGSSVKHDIAPVQKEVVAQNDVPVNPVVHQPAESTQPSAAASVDQSAPIVNQSAKQNLDTAKVVHQPAESTQPSAAASVDQSAPIVNQSAKQNLDTAKGDATAIVNDTVTGLLVSVNNDTNANVTTMDAGSDKLDLSGPGVAKRGVIVFGGFALLAVAYFLFYRKKSNSKDSNNSHSAIDTNQFRYGVLQSEDRRDNLELSRIPLTMESDDDEEDDLEIFDLEQKKKSMSYVNLQLNDEEIVNGPKEGSESNDRENLLLDIEDANTDVLINWSNSGNRSIL